MLRIEVKLSLKGETLFLLFLGEKIVGQGANLEDALSLKDDFGPASRL
jgi:hypothetical protein